MCNFASFLASKNFTGLHYEVGIVTLSAYRTAAKKEASWEEKQGRQRPGKAFGESVEGGLGMSPVGS
jgi:hypothetical protein